MMKHKFKKLPLEGDMRSNINSVLNGMRILLVYLILPSFNGLNWSLYKYLWGAVPNWEDVRTLELRFKSKASPPKLGGCPSG